MREATYEAITAQTLSSQYVAIAAHCSCVPFYLQVLLQHMLEFLGCCGGRPPQHPRNRHCTHDTDNETPTARKRGQHWDDCEKIQVRAARDGQIRPMETVSRLAHT